MSYPYMLSQDHYVAQILGEPIHSNIPLPGYLLHLRPLKEALVAQDLAQPEVILANGEHIPNNDHRLDAGNS